jgi:hypothetical protein
MIIEAVTAASSQNRRYFATVVWGHDYSTFIIIIGAQII